MIRTIRRSVLYYLLTVAAACALLIWNGYTRFQEFKSYHEELAEQSVAAAADEIELQLNELRHRVYLFAEEENDQIALLAANPDDEFRFFQLQTVVDRYFQDRLAFTVADDKGQVLVQDVELEVGERCQQDILAFSQRPDSTAIYVHPQSGAYHFDIIVPWMSPDEQLGYFFISFHPTMISRLLGISGVSGHQLMLIKDELSGIIELTEQGTRETIERPFNLSPDEQERVLASRPIAGTLWLLVDLPHADLLSRERDGIARQTGLVIVLLGVLSFVMFRFLQKSERNRYLAEAELRRTQHELALQVRDRTAQLSQAQSALQTEMDVRMHIQRMLKVREATIRSLLTCSRQAILTVSHDGEVVSASPEAAQLFGYTQDEMVGMQVSQVIIEAGETPIFSSRHENLQAQEVSECASQQTAIALHKEGGRVPVKISVSEARAGRQHIFTAFMTPG